MTLTTGSVATQTVAPHNQTHTAQVPDLAEGAPGRAAAVVAPANGAAANGTAANGAATNGAALAGSVLNGAVDGAPAEVADSVIDQESDVEPPRGSAAARARVSFVGAGPGDPDLLTVRAAALLADADVLVVDSRLRARFEPRCHERIRIIELAPAAPADDPLDAAPAAESVPAAHPLVCMDEISAAVRAGKSVVRLLDGDPGLFGSFEAEAVACAKAGLPFEVVPGLARATAVPVFAGIPLTKG